MMDTPDSVQPSAPVDAYQAYLNSGQIAPPAAAASPSSMPPLPPIASAAPVQPTGTFADMVKAKEAANGGKPLEEKDLDALSNNTWAQEEPAFRASRKGLKEGDVKAEKAAYDNQYQQFKADYLKQHAPATKSGIGGIGEGLVDAGKAALGSAGIQAAEAARYIPGGALAAVDALRNAYNGNDNSQLADPYFKAIDTVAKPVEEAGRTAVTEASKRSPFSAAAGQVGEALVGSLAGGGEAEGGTFLASHLPGALASGLEQSAQQVSDARAGGATAAQQEGIGASGLVGNTLLGLVPGGKSLPARLAIRAAGGAGLSAGQQAVQHAIAPNQVQAPTLGETGTQAAIAALLPEAHGALSKLVGARAAARGKANTPPPVTPPAGDTVGQQPDGSQVHQDPTTGKVTITPPGAGIDPAQHAQVVQEAQQQAADPSAIAAAQKAASSPNPAQEVLAQAAVHAQTAAEDTGADWSAMSPLQQHEATEAAAVALNRVAKVDGVPELLQANRQAATAAPTPAVQETDEPEVGTAPAPPAAAAPDAGTPPAAAQPPEPTSPISPSPLESPVDTELAQFGYQPQELAGLKTLDKVQLLTRLKRNEGAGGRNATSPNADLSQATAAEAMEGAGTPANPLAARAPTDSLDQTSGQASTIINKQLHAAMDEGLSSIKKGLRKTYPPSKLAKMTLEEKYHAYQADQASKATAAGLHDPTEARNAADEYAKALGVEPVEGETPGPATRGGHGLLPVDTTHETPLAGGVTLKGQPISGDSINGVVIDPSIPKSLPVGGHNVDVHWGITEHEIFESWLMHHYGMGYEAAHHGATQWENAQYAKRYPGVDPQKVQNALKPYLAKIDAEARAGGKQDQAPGYDAKPANNADMAETVNPLRSPNAATEDIPRKGLAAKKAPAPVEAPLPEPTPSSENADVVGQTLEGKVTPSTLTDVRAAMERAHGGDPAELYERINELRSDDTITADEAKALRRAGREPALNVAERDRPTTVAVDAGADDLLDVQRSEPTTELGKAADEVSQRAEEVKTNGLKSDRARANELVSKLRAEFAHSEVHTKAIDFLEWVLDKNPALSRGVNDVAKTPLSDTVNYGGRFGAVSRILELVDRPNMAANTAVHELMHASESLLPQPIREAILKARSDEIDRLASTATPAEKAMFEYLKNGARAETPSERVAYMHAARDELLNLRDTRASNRIGELYSLVNSSEYWAVNATKMLEEGYFKRGMLAKVQQWLKGFIDHIRSVFGSNPNQSAIVDGLHHVLGTQETGTQQVLRNYEITREAYRDQPTALTPAMEAEQLHNFVLQGQELEGNERTRSKMSRVREVLSASHASFDDFREGLLRNFGIKSATKNDLGLQTRLMMGLSGKLVQDDADQFMKPIINAFVKYSPEVDADSVKALAKLGEYRVIRSELTHQWPSEYRRSVPLDNGREVTRQKILDQITRKQITAADGEAKLTQLVKDNASQPFDAWARSSKGIAHSDTGETQYDRRLRKMAEYQKNGTAEVSKKFDPLYGALNKNIHDRKVQSGQVAADDPFAQGFDNNTWSTLAGYAADGRAEEIEPITTPMSDRMAKTLSSANAKQLNTAEGRASLASNGLLSPFQQMETAARNVARHNLTQSVLDTVTETKKTFKALAKTADAATLAKIKNHEITKTQIESFTGTPREGYDSVATGKHYDKLPTPANSAVHNDGRTHYVMTFPEGSEIYNGLRAIGTNWDPRDIPWVGAIADGAEHVLHKVTKPLGLGEPTHLITHSTNFLSQMRTIVNPVWDAATLLPRLLFEKPIMYALQNSRNPVGFSGKLYEAYAHTFGAIFSPGTGEWAQYMVTHDRDALRTLADAKPDSMAGWMRRMNEAGASTAFTQELTMHESKNALVQAVKREKQNPLIQGGRKILQYEQGIADVAENLPSIGIFRSLVKGGMSDKDAAALTKQAFDLQQRGTAGRALNSYHSFFRIGATAVDNLMRVFRDPRGLHTEVVMGRPVQTSVDWGKVGMLAGSMSGYAFLRYFLDREQLGEDENGRKRMAKIAGNNAVDIVQHGFIGNGTDKPFMYPSGLGAMQLLTAPGTLMAAVTAGDITPSEAFKAYGETLERNIPLMEGSPTPEKSGLLAHLYATATGAALPTVAEPGANVMANTNSFGQPIATNYPNDQKFEADQGKRTTPEMWKQIAQELQQHTGADFYPETLQFMSESYMGTAPTDLLRATVGQTNRTAQGLENNALGQSLRMQYQGAQYYDQDRMYKLQDELNQTRQQLNHVRLSAGPKGSPAYQAAGTAWLSSNPDAQSRLVALNQLDAAQKQYSAGIKALTESNDGPERKQYVRKQLDSALRVATDSAAKAIQ